MQVHSLAIEFCLLCMPTPLNLRPSSIESNCSRQAGRAYKACSNHQAGFRNQRGFCRHFARLMLIASWSRSGWLTKSRMWRSVQALGGGSRQKRLLCRPHRQFLGCFMMPASSLRCQLLLCLQQSLGACSNFSARHAHVCQQLHVHSLIKAVPRGWCSMKGCLPDCACRRPIRAVCQ